MALIWELGYGNISNVTLLLEQIFESISDISR